MFPRISIYFIILTYFGKDHQKLANKYVNETLKNINIRETLAFNKRCKKNKVLPRTLLQRPPLNTPLGHRIARSNGFNYLNAFIQDGYRLLRCSNRRLFDLKFQLQNVLPQYIISDLDDHIDKRKVRYRFNVKQRLQEKFNYLHSSQLHTNTSSNNWVINLSNHQLSDPELTLLKKGLNFSLPNSKKNLPTFVASVENCIQNLKNTSEEEKSIIRSRVTGAVKSHNNSEASYTSEEFSALKDLKRNEDIIIAPADKGCAVVVLNKSDYHTKIQDHLEDTNTYSEKDEDSTPSLRKKINSYLKSLFDKQILSKTQYYHLFANSATIPRFYALVKIHKEGNPIRPIVSFISSPSYNLAQFISKLLTPSTNKSPHKLKNSFDAKSKLKNVIIPNSYKLISFDVKSLFTCIPQNFALECVKEFLNFNNDIYDRTRLCSSEILKLVEICLDATLFSYNRKFFKQIKGTPMGSPVSVVLAEIVMQAIEHSIIPDINNAILFWYRYVDDIITCIKSDEIDNVLDKINSTNNDIKFTKECEINNSINFLDLKITKLNDGKLNFSIFRKSTHTDKYLDYKSYHPNQHKHSVIRSLVHRAVTLCDRNNVQDELNHINNVLQTNGYPKTSIDMITSKIRNQTSNVIVTNDNNSPFISAPYIKGTSERVARILKQYNIKLAHKPTRTLKHELCHLKDKRLTQDAAGVIYRLDCNDCDAVYVGETGRQVKDRMREHQSDILKAKPVSKVYSHVNASGHSFDFQNVRILDSSQHVKIRLQLESIHTELQSNPINRSLTLNNIYHPIFHSSSNN